MTEPFILPFGRGADPAGVRPGRGDDRRAGHREDRTLPVAALTAWQALVDYAALEPGMRVLVQGGAGGVGGYAVQLAAILGGIVTVTGSARQRDLVQRLGAATFVASGASGAAVYGAAAQSDYDVVIWENTRQLAARGHPELGSAARACRRR